MKVEECLAPVKAFYKEHKTTIDIQISSFVALFCWFPLIPNKLDAQRRVITVRDLRQIRHESLRTVFRNWAGLRAEMAFQPLFPLVFIAKERIMTQMKCRNEILASCLAGGLSGPVSNALNEMIKQTRLYPQERLLALLKKVSFQDLFRGSLLMSCRNAGFGSVFFGLNPQLTRYIEGKVDHPQKKLIAGFGSAIPSSILAVILTMPFDTAALYKRENSLRRVYEKHGVKAFVVGTRQRGLAAVIELIAFNMVFGFLRGSSS